MHRVGIVGLGLLGTAVASRLLHGGVEVTGYDLRAEQSDALASAGLRAAEHTAGACEGVDAVFTMSAFCRRGRCRPGIGGPGVRHDRCRRSGKPIIIERKLRSPQTVPRCGLSEF